MIKTLNIQKKKKGNKGKRQTYKGRPIRKTLDFSTETLKTGVLADVLQNLWDHRCQNKILYPANRSITSHKESKTSVTKNIQHKALEQKFQPTNGDHTSQ